MAALLGQLAGSIFFFVMVFAVTRAVARHSKKRFIIELTVLTVALIFRIVIDTDILMPMFVGYVLLVAYSLFDNFKKAKKNDDKTSA